MTDTRTCTLCSCPTDREHSGTYILTLVQTSGGVNSQRRELTITALNTATPSRPSAAAAKAEPRSP